MVKIQATIEYKKMSKILNQPKQERSQKRMDQVILTTEKMLLDIGIEKISIPEIAKQSGVPRASIYQFFPSKYDLLRHISLKYLHQLIGELKLVAMQVFLDHPNQQLNQYGRLLTSALIQHAAKFHNDSPIATLLILSGAVTQQSYVEYQVELNKVSVAIRQALKMIHLDHYVPQHPDTLTILIELIFSCMKYGYYTENYISEAICQEAYRAGIAYLTALKNDSFHMHKD